MKFIKRYMFLLFFIFSCQKTSNLDLALELAKSNRAELEKVLNHYISKEDTLGLASAKYLVQNMSNKETFKDSANSRDIETLDSQSMIENIDLSIKMAGQDLRSGKISLEIFYDFILPYKQGKEPLTQWRRLAIEKYQSAKDSGQGVDAFINTIRNINSELIDNFKYNTNVKNAEYRTWEDLNTNKDGDCWAMTKVICYSLRAIGIPTAVDHIPLWGNSNGGLHAWNALVLPNRVSVPFLGGEGSPPEYNPFRIYKTLMRYPPKIFRRTFSLPSNSNKVSPYLSKNGIIDVTDSYLKVNDIRIKIPKNYSTETLYLSVYSNGKWVPVSSAVDSSGISKFSKMASDILYLPSTINELNEVQQSTFPFVIINNRKVSYKPDTINRIRLVISSTDSKESVALKLYEEQLPKVVFYDKMEKIYNSSDWKPPVDNFTYKLYYWDQGWKYVSDIVKTPGQSLIFENVPSKAIYRLVSKSILENARIFSYENDSQVWW